MRKALVFFVCVLIAISVFAVDDSTKKAIEEAIGYGVIDWQNGLVIATGYGAYNLQDRHVGRGRLMALRAAELDAKRNLLETLEGVRITSETVVKNYQTESDVIYSRMDGFIKGARRHGEERYNSDGTVEVDIAVPLFGERGLIGVISPGLNFGDIMVPNIANPVYSGMIVIIEDKNAKPMLAPTVESESGVIIYAASKVNKDYAIQVGIVGYDTDLERAKKNDRVTANPLVVRALRIQGDKVIISNADADKILKVKEQLSFIEQCRVMFILQ